MTKKTEKSKKLGRPEQLDVAKLPDRYRDIKLFLENHWGRVGLELKRVRQPDDVRTILKRVTGIEWMKPFKEHAICLIADAATKASAKEVRATRQKYEDAVVKEDRLWFEYLNTQSSAQQAMTALKGTISDFREALEFFPFFLLVSLLARELRVEELTKLSIQLERSSRQSQQEKQALKERLNAQEAWHARNEIVKFVHNNREDKTLINFARVMAGLPEWGWLHSLRQCKKIQDDTAPAYPQQIFELLRAIVRGMRPLKLINVEKRLREKLLGTGCDPVLRGYVTGHWHYLQDAIHHCRGVARGELPYKIMDRFLYHLERPKSPMDLELAKRNQLV